MPLELIVALVAVFVTVALGAGYLTATVLARQAPEARRLRQFAVQGPTGIVLPEGTLDTAASQRKVPAFVPKSPKEMSALRRRLARAGYHSERAVMIYAVSELVLPITLGLLPLLFLPLRTALIVGLFAAVVGYLLPGLVLESRVRARKRVIENGLPDALDLFIVCLEAGSSLDQAIAKATEELEIAYPALTEELRMLSIETRAGKPRLEAFRNLAQRTQVDDVRALVAMLAQTDRFGTSIAQALRIQAATARTKRRQRAEERAAKIGVKLVFPLVFFLFPALYVVTLGPAVIQFVRVFFGSMAK